MQKKLNAKREQAAYVLNKDPDLNFPQKDIAELMKVSPSTISKTVQKQELLNKIDQLEKENNLLRQQAQAQLPPDSQTIDIE